eukprot:1160475-Pelagomonas_calceolata.AAC.7
MIKSLKFLAKALEGICFLSSWSSVQLKFIRTMEQQLSKEYKGLCVMGQEQCAACERDAHFTALRYQIKDGLIASAGTSGTPEHVRGAWN